MFKCNYCQYQSRHFLSWCFHNNIKHSQEPGFIIACLYPSCGKTFKNVKSCQRHLRTFHKKFYSTLIPRQCGNQHRTEPDVNQNVQLDNSTASEEPEQEDINYTQYLATSLLSIKENTKIADKSLFSICENLITISNRVYVDTVKKAKRVLQDSNIDIDNPVVKSVLAEVSPLALGWDEINSSKKLDKYAFNNLCCVKPVEIVLDQTNGVTESYQYVPVLETLKFLLNFKDIQSYVFNSHKSDDNVLRDLCDGTVFISNPLFSSEETALQIHFYLDEVNFVNPLGNKVKNHKIYAFYMQLGNVLPSRRSTLESIFLVALCKSKYVRKYGMQTVLEAFINDVKILETEGLTLDINGTPLNFKGSLLICIADNLAAHGIGGFIESFSSLKVCRFCMISKHQLSEIFVDIERSKDSYDQQCALVEECPDLCKVYGIKHKSCLNDLEYFHVVNGLPADLTHDLFEGVGKYVLKHVIDYCILQRFFTFEALNEMIENFEYHGTDKVNKPQVLPASHEIKQTASQTWCLLRLFPLIVGNHIPPDDAKWNILLLLLDITEFVCMQEIEPGQVLFLNDLIQELSDSYKKEFPEETVKPKFHFMHHYSDLIFKFGPLVHCWSVRFEAKHNWFKQSFSSSRCFKNVEKTLAKRHQLMLSSFATKENFFSRPIFETTGGKIVPINDFVARTQEIIKLAFGNVNELYRSKHLHVHGSIISSGCAIPMGESGDLIQFNEVKYSFVHNEEAYLLCEQLCTQNYVRHYHAFKVCGGGPLCMLKVSDLVSMSNFTVLGIYSVSGEKYISLKVRNISSGYKLKQSD